MENLIKESLYIEKSVVLDFISKQLAKNNFTIENRKYNQGKNDVLEELLELLNIN